MSEPLVLAEGLEKDYPGPRGPVRALRGVSLTVAAGEALAITGPSGCGKTTLLHLLGALDRPTGGRLRVAGREPGALDPRGRALLRREAIGFVFQHYRLIPTLTAEENVALPLRYAGVPPQERRRRAAELLERVGLLDRAGHLPAALSGGEQQRVAVARALVARPRLLLADEPTGNLDRATAGQVLPLLREGPGQGAALIVVTHDPEVAARMDRQVALRDGLLDVSP